MENLKKVYKIGDTIEKSELLEVAEGITKKALKVIASSGNMYAFDILDKKDFAMYEDITQSVIIALIENNYIITKECYKIVNNMLYNYKKSQVVLHIDADADANELNANAYIEYITTDFTQEKSQKSDIISLQAIYNILTPRQNEILKIYTNLGNIQHTADFLGISRQGVQNALNDIKHKLSYIIV